MSEQQPEIGLQVLPGRPALVQTQTPQVVYLLVEAQPPAQPERQAAQPINLCLVVDRSTSMRGERLFQVKQAANHIVSELGPQDCFSLVVFNDRAELVVPSQHPTDQQTIGGQIARIEARGGTELASGLELGLQQLERGRTAGCINRLILLTDGRTYGDEERCLALARLAQRRGIGITALGLGDEWNEDLLEAMTAGENCRTQYITAAQQIFDAFERELRRLHSTVAQQIELQLLARPGVELRALYRVQPFLEPLDLPALRAGQWRAALGDWSSGEAQALLLELVVPALPAGLQPFLRLDLHYQLPARGTARTVVDCALPVLPAAQVGGVAAQVAACVERVVAHRLQAQAWQQLAEGRLQDATRRLEMAGTRLLNVGEPALAQTIREEALRMARQGRASEEGRKRIRYGTRGLVAQPALLVA